LVKKYVELIIIILPIIEYKLGISWKINKPIKTPKNIRVYSNGAKNDGWQNLKAVIEQNCVAIPSNPVPAKSIRSCILKICQPPVFNMPEKITIHMFEYSIIVIVESVLERILALIIEHEANILASKAVTIAKSNKKDVGLITNITPQ
jgi:hypothetical protein